MGALFFGWLTDRLGRKKMFTITVLIYVDLRVRKEALDVGDLLGSPASQAVPPMRMGS